MADVAPGEDMADVSRLVFRAVVWHPSLWPVAAATGLRLARRGWWRSWPPLPLPDERYWAFRMETALGSPQAADLSPHDVRAYLRWCRGAGGRGK